jgi:hypothetical protein
MSGGDFDWLSLKPKEADDGSADAASSSDASAGYSSSDGSAPDGNTAAGASTNAMPDAGPSSWSDVVSRFHNQNQAGSISQRHPPRPSRHRNQTRSRCPGACPRAIPTSPTKITSFRYGDEETEYLNQNRIPFELGFEALLYFVTHRSQPPGLEWECL